MKSKIKFIASISILVVVSTLYSFAQNAQWKVGDKVEILNLSKEWVPGTIIGTVDWNGKTVYRVQLDDPNASTVYFNHTPDSDIRARGGQNAKQQNIQAENVNQTMPPNGEIGSRVDVYYNQKQGKNHATILEAANGKYKVHYTGCTSKWDEWVDASLIRPLSTISKDAPEIKFLMSKWSLTTVAVNSNGSGTLMAWGKSPGIQLNGDGTYIWYQESGKPPVKGQWIIDSKIAGADSGTQKYDGVLIKDADGQEWKVFRWMTKDDDGNHVEVQRMCSGSSNIGRRVR